MNSIRFSSKSFKLSSIHWGLIVVGLALILGLTQDFLHSSIKGYNFYWSESLLYNSFSVLFIPIALLQSRVMALKQMSSGKQLLLKISLVSLTFTAIHLFTFPLVVHSLSRLLLDHSFHYNKVLQYTLSEKLYLTIAIYGLITVILFRRTKPNSAPTKKEYIKQLSLSRKNEKVIINTSEIFSIHSENPYIKIITSQGEFLHNQSLKSIYEMLDGDTFIRVHKSAIINTKELASYKSRLNGDYDITLTNGSVVRMSRNFSSEFKKRFF